MNVFNIHICHESSACLIVDDSFVQDRAWFEV